MLTKNKYIKIILILIAAVVAFNGVVYPAKCPLENKGLSNKAHLRPPFLSQDQNRIDAGKTITRNIVAETRLEGAYLLSDRESALYEICNSLGVQVVNLILTTSSGRTRRIRIPWSEDPKLQKIALEHLSLLSFNLALYGRNRFLFIDVPHNLKMETFLATQVQKYLNTVYQRHLALYALTDKIVVLPRSKQQSIAREMPFPSPPKYLPAPKKPFPPRLCIGVDIGSSSIKLAAFKEGKVVLENEYPYNVQGGAEAFLDSVRRAIESFLDTGNFGELPSRVVILVPGIVEENVSSSLGFIERNWSKEDREKAKLVSKILEEHWSGKILFHVKNDIQGAAEGILVEENIDDANVIYWGSGVGGAVVQNGRVLDEPTNFGTFRIAATSPTDKSLGQASHVQFFAGVPFLQEKAKRLGFKPSFQGLTIEPLKDLALEGWRKAEQEKAASLLDDEKIAMELMENATKCIFENIREGVLVTGNTTIAAIGGNFEGEFGDKVVYMLNKMAAEKMPHQIIQIIRPNSHPKKIGARGAAYLAAAIEQQLHIEPVPAIETWYPLVAQERLIQKIIGEQVKSKIQRIDQMVDQFAAQRLQERGPADLVILIPTYKRSDNIPNVVRNIVEGLRKYYPDRKAVIILTGEKERAADFKYNFEKAKQHVPADDSYIQIVSMIKDEEHKGKGWSLRILLRYLKKACHSGAFLLIDDDIRNIRPDWIKRFLEPIEQGKDMVFSSYSARRYARDDRPLKDLFVTPFFSAFLGMRLLEAEGEYGGRQGPISDALLENYTIWGYDFPEFFFIPTAVRLGGRIQGVNFDQKDHDPEQNPFDRFPKYVQTFFDFTLTNPWLADQEELVKVSEHNLLSIATRDFIDINPQDLLEQIRREEVSRFIQLYTEVLPADICNLIRKHLQPASSLQEDPFTAEQWAKTVFLFLRCYRRLPFQERTQILPALTPLLKLRVASFASEAQSKNLSFPEVRALLDEQADLFVKEREIFFEAEYQSAVSRFLMAKTEGKKYQAISQLGIAGARKDMINIQIGIKHSGGNVSYENIRIPTRFLQEHYEPLVEYLASVLADYAEFKGLIAIHVKIGRDLDISQEQLLADLKRRFEHDFTTPSSHGNFGRFVAWGGVGFETATPWSISPDQLIPLEEEIGFGVDISADRIRVIAFDGKMPIYKREIPISKGHRSVGQLLEHALYQIANEFRVSIEHLASMKLVVGVPGLVDPENNIIDLPQLEKELPGTKESLESLRIKFPNLKFKNAANLSAIYLAQSLGQRGREGVFVLTTFRTGLGFSIVVDGSLPPSPLEAHSKYNFNMDASTCRCGIQGCLYTVSSPIGMISQMQEEIRNGQGLAQLPVSSSTIKKIRDFRVEDIPAIINELTNLLYDPHQDVRKLVEIHLEEMGRGLGSLYARVARIYGINKITTVRTGWVNDSRTKELIQRGINEYLETDAPEVQVIDVSGDLRGLVEDNMYGAAGSAILGHHISYPQTGASVNITKRKISITGVTGTLGRCLASYLLNKGYEVQGLVRPLPDRTSIFSGRKKFTSLKGDLLSNTSLKALVSDSDVVHLEGAITETEKMPRTSIPDVAELLAVNGFVPDRVVRLRDRMGRTEETRIVFISSQVVYWTGEQRRDDLDEGILPEYPPAVKEWIETAVKEYSDSKRQREFDSKDDLRETLVKWLIDFITRNPIPKQEDIYPYKLAKLIAERLLAGRKDVVIVRPTTLFGEGDVSLNHRIPKAIRAVARGQMGEYPDLITDYVHLYDVADLLFRIGELKEIRPGENDIINAASGYNTTSEDFKMAASDYLLPAESQRLAIMGHAKKLIPPRFNNKRAIQIWGRQPLRLEQGIGAQIEENRKVEGREEMGPQPRGIPNLIPSTLSSLRSL